jgi:type VI secretion system FHA domain protein
MIVLTVKSFNGAPTDALSASFDELGGTIGRADSNQLVLPDPERSISRVHAQVVFRNGGYALVDRGSNPVIVNGTPLGNGREAPLRDGDAVQIGGYLLSASMGHKTQAADPFADLFGSPPLAAPAAPFPVTSASVARPLPPAKPATAPAAGGIPDDWDPFAPDASAGSALGLAPGPAANPFANTALPDLPVAAPSRSDSLDALFGLGANGGTDPFSAGGSPLDPFASHPAAAAPAVANTASDADPLRALSQPAAPVAAPLADHVSELNTPWPSAPLQPAMPPRATPPGAILSWDQPSREGKVVTLPAVRRPLAPEPVADVPDVTRIVVGKPAASTPAPEPAPTAPADALLRALCEGLGVPHLQLQTLGPEQLRLVGQLLRESTRGTVELLLARAALKREMRAEVTMIVARENNPLKFSPTVEVALQHLLGPTANGFMQPAAAMRDAFDDLRAHQLGVMAGMRAALEGVLQRFDPAVLEGKLSKRSGLSGLLPGSRKAQLWEAFQQLYAQLSQEAADDFQELFGKAFLQAYEQHIEQLQSE